MRRHVLWLVRLLWPLCAWEAMLREGWGRQLSQEDARRLTIGELLQSKQDTGGVMEACFDAFAGAWNELVAAIREGGIVAARYRQEADCSPVEPSDMPLMGRDCKVSLCCLDRSGEGNLKNLLQLFLQMLGGVQNDLLRAATQLVPRCAATSGAQTYPPRHSQ